MSRGAAILAAAALSLAGAMAVRAMPPGAGAVVDEAVTAEGMPRTLSEYGFFVDAAAQIPSRNVIPYRLNTPLFSDGAEKLRFVYVPQGRQIAVEGEGLLDIPVGGALIKTFAFGKGADRRLIETRVLLHRADGWLALPYIWNEEQTEAALAVVGGRKEVTTPAGETISYRVPNKNQCKECHGLQGAVVPIGPKARNLSQDWLQDMVAAKHLAAMPATRDTMPRWEDRASVPAEAAARAYLDVNCAHCHRPNATASNSGLDLRWEQDDRQALGVFKRPVAAGRGSGGHEFAVVPGRPDDSILTYRMDSVEPGVAMPELGKSTVDEDGLAVVRRWIAGMPAS
ncbi:SO2930 family diheme c-type cytochrome [Qipengyuania spongiae]|uniref:Cytochrome c domain-containing protein n=1 Tax=Qipengyuania spongiae TaxID=2909673 RepID=A0ABY5SWX0_9SPHN|nr:SO2930 family diheme c-type cytochrome [Qipengyuania spongiae]UVI38351.1 hypothetical protein L1F33_08755 [Qipengyuania spongiae]